MPFIISLYIIRKTVFYLIIILALVATLFFIFDFVELVKVTSARQAPLSLAAHLAILKNYEHVSKTFPFIFILVTLATYTHLTRTFELVALRTFGISVWQFLIPVLLVAFIFGVFVVTALNPLGAMLLSRYERIEGTHLKGHGNLVAISENGLWLRDFELESGNSRIIHTLRIAQQGNEFFDISIFIMDEKYNFLKRVDAGYAQLEDGKNWVITNATVVDKSYNKSHYAKLLMPTHMNFAQIQESLISPETISIYKLPSFIWSTQASGLSITKHLNYFYKTLMLPFFYCSMVLIAINFSTALPRSGKVGRSIFYGILLGFVIYFLSDVMNALGLAGNLPIILTASAPTLICLSVGTYLTLHYEDG